MSKRLLKLWSENKVFFVFICLMLVFRSAVADWNDVPTGSMKPTIIEGDRIFINKMAYDVRIPFTLVSLYKVADPVRGDIIIFDSAASNKRLVKRVIGVPGDTVSLRDNVLTVNGQELEYNLVEHSGNIIEQTEDLLGVTHRVWVNEFGSRLSKFKAVTVPKGSYLALGDNRDNSGDSRVIGFVPRKEIVGRSRSVALSFDYDNYYIPRSGRYFQAL